jgi:serine/threonine protein kinase
MLQTMDIWSLGVTAFFILANHSLWSTRISPSALLQQEDIHSTLNLFGYKEKAFLEGCLQVDPSHHLRAVNLLDKSLFKTRCSTFEATSLKVDDALRSKFDEVCRALNECPRLDQISEEFASSLSDFYVCFMNERDRREG